MGYPKAIKKISMKRLRKLRLKMIVGMGCINLETIIWTRKFMKNYKTLRYPAHTPFFLIQLYQKDIKIQWIKIYYLAQGKSKKLINRDFSYQNYNI